MTKEGLPVTISFFGLAWSEPKLLGYGYDFEQATASSPPAETHAGAAERHALVLTNRRAGTARAAPNGTARAFDSRG